MFRGKPVWDSSAHRFAPVDILRLGYSPYLVRVADTEARSRGSPPRKKINGREVRERGTCEISDPRFGLKSQPGMIGRKGGGRSQRAGQGRAEAGTLIGGQHA